MYVVVILVTQNPISMILSVSVLDRMYKLYRIGPNVQTKLS